MTYKIIDGKIYQESEKTVEQINESIKRIQERAKASITGIATCKEEIAKQQNQIDIYINNIKALAKMEGIDKGLISLVQDPNSLTFCTYID